MYLRVRIDDPKLNANQLAENHAVDSIGAATTHAYDLQID